MIEASVIKELNDTIRKLKLEILDKQEELIELINKYQELTGTDIMYQEINEMELEQFNN